MSCLAFVMFSVCRVLRLSGQVFVVYSVYVLHFSCLVCVVFVLSSICFVLRLSCLAFVMSTVYIMSNVCYICSLSFHCLSCLVFVCPGSVVIPVELNDLRI